jgi:hypothetical protein
MRKKLRGSFASFLAIGALATMAHIAQASPARISLNSGPVATVNRRIETDNLEISVYQGKRRVQLQTFVQLLVITPLAGRAETVENLVGASVAIVPSNRPSKRLEVHLLSPVVFLSHDDGHSHRISYDATQQPQNMYREYTFQQMLADNVFIVKQVLVSSQRNPVELRIAGEPIQVKRGDALLVL